MWVGAHQRLNRCAYRIVKPETDMAVFPGTKLINHFEGANGPDGLKRKSSGKDEPYHFYNPATGRGAVTSEIKNHYLGLVQALKRKDHERSAFEASWLAHAVTDGLTPPHHYPYVEKLSELKGSSPAEVTRMKDKFILRGKTKRETVKQTWKLVGAKGLLSTHAHFEAGFSTIMLGKPIRVPLDRAEFERAEQMGPVLFFKEQAKLVAQLKMYERFTKRGWTAGLARQVRRVLAPTIAQTIGIIWLMAYEEAGYELKSHRLGPVR